jgi:hypothetical protein
MKYIKLFENFSPDKYGKILESVELPVDQKGLDELEKMPSFKNIKDLLVRSRLNRNYNINYDREIHIIRGGSIEINGPSYNFKIGKNGGYYYGSYKVGPKWASLDTWDKIFDYVYIYYLANTATNAQSAELERFVFYGEISVGAYNKIKDSEFYQKILELSRKYNGQAADEAINKAIGETANYITDPKKLLEMPSYKFFDNIFNLKMVEYGTDGHSVKITLQNKTPYGIFDNMDGMSFRQDIYIMLEGSDAPASQKIRVKTLKGLDKAFLKEIKNLSDQSIWNVRKEMEPIAKLSLAIFKNIVEAYENGNNASPVIVDEVIKLLDVNNISYVKNDLFNIDLYIRVVSDILEQSEIFGPKIAEYVNNNTEITDKIKSTLFNLKNRDVLDYTRLVKEMESSKVKLFADIAKELISSDPQTVKGGSMLRRFGVNKDKEI